MLKIKFIRQGINKIWGLFQDKNAVTIVNHYAKICGLKEYVNVCNMPEDEYNELNGGASTDIVYSIGFTPTAMKYLKAIDTLLSEVSDTTKCMHGLVGHEIIHLYFDDSATGWLLLGLINAPDNDECNCLRVLNVLTELRADILGTQLVNKVGYLKLDKLEDFEILHMNVTEEIEEDSIKDGYPRLEDRVNFSYKYGVREDNTLPIEFTSRMAREIAIKYLAIYNITTKDFVKFLKLLYRETRNKTKREWYKVWLALLCERKEGEISK